MKIKPIFKALLIATIVQPLLAIVVREVFARLLWNAYKTGSDKFFHLLHMRIYVYFGLCLLLMITLVVVYRRKMHWGVHIALCLYQVALYRFFSVGFISY
ncbi:MAG: hypothetical protein EOP51_01215 [Sphingobacteriales bacterium]|nr:MAG: hypothetical protein EOP51_01215 [Sphingobacteriales bacterium]